MAALAVALAACGSSSYGDPEPGPRCGELEGSHVTLTVEEIIVNPSKLDGTPWDWDGELPDGLIGAANLLASILRDQRVRTAAEVLELIDEHAPALFRATVPPDPFIDYLVMESGEWFTLGTGSVTDDSYIVLPEYALEADLTFASALALRLIDEDVVFHDSIDDLVFDAALLEDLVHCGPQTVSNPAPNIAQVRFRVDE